MVTFMRPPPEATRASHPLSPSFPHSATTACMSLTELPSVQSLPSVSRCSRILFTPLSAACMDARLTGRRWFEVRFQVQEPHKPHKPTGISFFHNLTAPGLLPARHWGGEPDHPPPPSSLHTHF